MLIIFLAEILTAGKDRTKANTRAHSRIRTPSRHFPRMKITKGRIMRAKIIPR